MSGARRRRSATPSPFSSISLIISHAHSRTHTLSRAHSRSISLSFALSRALSLSRFFFLPLIVSTAPLYISCSSQHNAGP